MSDLKNVISDILNKKFSKANGQFGNMMRDKVYNAISDFKNNFKYVTQELKPVEVKVKDNQDG